MNEEIVGGVSPLKKKARQSSRGGEHAGKATAKKGGYLGGRGGYAKSTGVRGGGGRNVGGYNVHTRFKPREKPDTPKGSSTKTPKENNKPYSFDENGDIVINLGDNINTLTGGVNGGSKATATATATATADGWEWVPGEDGTGGEWKTETWKSGGKNVESYKQVWDRKESKYTSGGQSARMSQEHYDTLNLNSVQKDGKVIHKSFEDYVQYMQAKSKWRKTSEGKKWSEENLSSSSEKTHTKKVYVKGTKGKKGYWKKVEGGGGTQTQTQTQTS